MNSRRTPMMTMSFTPRFLFMRSTTPKARFQGFTNQVSRFRGFQSFKNRPVKASQVSRSQITRTRLELETMKPRNLETSETMKRQKLETLETLKPLNFEACRSLLRCLLIRRGDGGNR